MYFFHSGKMAEKQKTEYERNDAARKELEKQLEALRLRNKVIQESPEYKDEQIKTLKSKVEQLETVIALQDEALDKMMRSVLLSRVIVECSSAIVYSRPYIRDSGRSYRIPY